MAPVAPVAAEPAPPAPSSEPERLAVVKETLSTERYTFFRMDACGQEAWVAAPPTEGVSEGDVLEMPGGMVMTDFESATLDRTFDAILFVQWVRETDKEPECRPPVMPTEDQRVGIVVETEEAGGYHYAKLDHCGKEFWIAAQGPPIQPGTTLLTEKGSVMTDFTSPSTGETFDEIVFVARYQTVPNVPMCDE